MSLPNFTEYNLRLHNNELSDREKLNFYEQLHRLDSSDSLKIYRGESMQRLYNSYQSKNLNEFNAKFFIVGPKGNAFHRAQTNRLRIDQSGVNAFELIFDWLKEFSSGDLTNSKINGPLKRFRDNNERLREYFSDGSNREPFLEKVLDLDEENRIKVRDYYLTLLHHNGESIYYANSFLLSVTKSYEIAKQFAGSRDLHNDKVIVFGWVPRKHVDRVLPNTFSYSGAGKYLNQVPVIIENDLPAYDKPLFAHQKEISLKGGLFVHYIIGYLRIHNAIEDFHVNPAFLNNTTNWIEDGLDVDQTDFPELLETTSLTGGFYNRNDGTFTENL